MDSEPNSMDLSRDLEDNEDVTLDNGESSP